MLPKKLKHKLEQRKQNNALRSLGNYNNLVDFSSNDYLGFAKNTAIFNAAHQFLIDNNIKKNGATGSRLLSGNYNLYTTTESFLANFHNSESALIFNSGYSANIGLFSCVPQRGDVVFYDEYIHASIRDGIQLSNAKTYKFQHNNIDDLNEKLKRLKNLDNQDIYVVTESVFSMDGDTPDLKKLSQFCDKNNLNLIIDEAHALGVFGNQGSGIVQRLGIEALVFARIVTFGKALGCHGAAILGHVSLKDYLINFSRPFIYTTGLSPHALATIKTAYGELNKAENLQKLEQNISHFNSEIKRLGFQVLSEVSGQNISFIKSNSAIHCCVISGNDRVKSISKQLQKHGFDVKPILSPTVPEGNERLRFCLHSYNSTSQITEVLELLATFV